MITGVIKNNARNGSTLIVTLPCSLYDLRNHLASIGITSEASKLTVGGTENIKVQLAAAEPVLAELGTARKDYEMAKYAGFSEEEMIQYAFLSNRIKENICRVLKKEDMQITARKKKKPKAPRV